MLIKIILTQFLLKVVKDLAYKTIICWYCESVETIQTVQNEKNYKKYEGIGVLYKIIYL